MAMSALPWVTSQACGAWIVVNPHCCPKSGSFGIEAATKTGSGSAYWTEALRE